MQGNSCMRWFVCLFFASVPVLGTAYWKARSPFHYHEKLTMHLILRNTSITTSKQNSFKFSKLSRLWPDPNFSMSELNHVASNEENKRRHRTHSECSVGNRTWRLFGLLRKVDVRKWNHRCSTSDDWRNAESKEFRARKQHHQVRTLELIGMIELNLCVCHLLPNTTSFLCTSTTFDELKIFLLAANALSRWNIV